jgi:hypothetical protein
MADQEPSIPWQLQDSEISSEMLAAMEQSARRAVEKAKVVLSYVLTTLEGMRPYQWKIDSAVYYTSPLSHRFYNSVNSDLFFICIDDIDISDHANVRKYLSDALYNADIERCSNHDN